MKKSWRVLALLKLVSSGFRISSANLQFQLTTFSKHLENHGKLARLTTATVTCYLSTKLLPHKLITSFRSQLMMQKLLNLLVMSQSTTRHSIQSQLKWKHTLVILRALNGSRIWALDSVWKTNHTSQNLLICHNSKTFISRSYHKPRKLHLLTCSVNLSNVSLTKLRLTNSTCCLRRLTQRK